MKIRLTLFSAIAMLFSAISFGQEAEGSLSAALIEREAGVVNEEKVHDLSQFKEVKKSKADVDDNLTTLPVKKVKKKRVKIKDIFKAVKKTKSLRGADAMTILLVILALFIPPLAVGIFEGITGRFWIDLILFLVGIGVGIWLLGPAIGWLCGLVAVIYAILIILGVI